MKTNGTVMKYLTGFFLIMITIIYVGSVVMPKLNEGLRQRKQELQRKIAYYENMANRERQWVYKNQVENGALLFYKEETGITSVIPYFSNIAAESLMGRTFVAKDREVVLRYLQWYFSHLNTEETDPVNGSGTIFNYQITMEDNRMIAEKSTGKYDSVDSYAASFLIGLKKYYQQTGDSAYLQEHMESIFEVIEALGKTFDTNGLSKTDQKLQIKYLMDNVEVNKALKESLDLLKDLLGNKNFRASSYYKRGQKYVKTIEGNLKKNKKAIEEILWNSEAGRYEVGLDAQDSVIHFQGWSLFYPDAIAQIYPIVFGVIEPDSARAVKLYETFCNVYQWESLQHYETGNIDFYWCVLSYMGAVMGDESRVSNFFSYYDRNFEKMHKYPFYIAESGWCIMACDEMCDYYEEKIRNIRFIELIKMALF